MSEIKKSFTTEKFVATYPVEPNQDGWRLDQFVQKCMPTLSRQYIKKKIDKGEVQISGRKSPHKPSVKVHHLEEITIITHNDGMIEDEFWRGKVIERTEKPQIVFEDEDILVIHKPPFMITHPAGKNLFYCATVYFETLLKHKVHSIHRLDRETSGLLMLGKNPRSSAKVAELFENDLVRKCYFLIAHKKENATPFPFTAKERMDRVEGSFPAGIMSIFPEDSDQGKDSTTHFELVLEKKDYVLALAFPETGRQHQIRLHASFHGYPLLGDKLYNGDSNVFIRFKDFEATDEDHELMQISRQALHAIGLKLAYPGPEMNHFMAPLPMDLSDWLESKLNLKREDVEKMLEEKILKFFDKI